MEIKAFKAISDSVVSVVLEHHPYHFEFGVIRHFTIKTGQNIFGRPDSKASNICDELKLILFGNEITINKYYFEEIDFKTCRYEYEWFTNRKNNFLEAFGIGDVGIGSVGSVGIAIAARMKDYQIPYTPVELSTIGIPNIHDLKPKQQ